jgi:hypothetical protein
MSEATGVPRRFPVDIDSSWRQRRLLKEVDFDEPRSEAESVCRAFREPRTREMCPTLTDGRFPRRRLLSVIKGVAENIKPQNIDALFELLKLVLEGSFFVFVKTIERIAFSIFSFFPRRTKTPTLWRATLVDSRETETTLEIEK